LKESNRLVEEFMLLANGVVAEKIYEQFTFYPGLLVSSFSITLMLSSYLKAFQKIPCCEDTLSLFPLA